MVNVPLAKGFPATRSTFVLPDAEPWRAAGALRVTMGRIDLVSSDAEPRRAAGALRVTMGRIDLVSSDAEPWRAAGALRVAKRRIPLHRCPTACLVEGTDRVRAGWCRCPGWSHPDGE